MPKILSGVRENILKKAKEMLFAEGYQSLSIRGVAAACGIATGTFYNYFKNKDFLIASIMVQDWKTALDEMQTKTASAASVSEGMDGIYQAIRTYVSIYEKVWEQSGKEGATAITPERHQFLCGQIQEVVESLLCDRGYGERKDFAVFLAETVLSSATKTYLLPHFKEMVETMFPSKGGEHE